MRILLDKFYNINTYPVLRVCVLGITLLVSSSVFAQETQFQRLVQRVFQQPYDELPQLKVSSKRFGKKGDNPKNKLFKAARRTLSDESDWLPSCLLYTSPSPRDRG